MVLELIGEEIYDEFDPQGAQGDPYKYDKSGPSPSVPTNAHPLGPDEQASSPNTPLSPLASTAETSSQRTPHLIPPRMKGLGFLMGRSRSAPPVNRDQDFKHGRKDLRGDVVPEADDDSEDEKLEDKEKTIGDVCTTVRDDNQGPGVVITLTTPGEGESTPALDRRLSAAQEIKMPRPIRGLPSTAIQRFGAANLNFNNISTSINGSGGMNLGSKSLNNSRNTSPTPSLEAILVERTRRRLATRSPPVGSMGFPASSAVATHLNPELATRGRRFKSSPLNSIGTNLSMREEGDDNDA